MTTRILIADDHPIVLAGIRDVLAGRPSILMRPELYVTAAALSATRASRVSATP